MGAAAALAATGPSPGGAPHALDAPAQQAVAPGPYQYHRDPHVVAMPAAAPSLQAQPRVGGPSQLAAAPRQAAAPSSPTLAGSSAAVGAPRPAAAPAPAHAVGLPDPTGGSAGALQGPPPPPIAPSPPPPPTALASPAPPFVPLPATPTFWWGTATAAYQVGVGPRRGSASS